MSQSGWGIALSVMLVSACGGETPLAPSSPLPAAPGGAAVEFATVSGWVYARADADHPSLVEALIEVKYGDGARETVLTDADGYYQIAVRPGIVTITASKEGYEAKSWELTLLNDTVLNFGLTAQ